MITKIVTQRILHPIPNISNNSPLPAAAARELTFLVWSLFSFCPEPGAVECNHLQ